MIVKVVTILLILRTSIGSPVGLTSDDDAQNLKIPYVVSIQSGLYEFKHECVGVIISPYWVITAAHCVGISLIISRVVAGASDLNNIENSTLQIRNINLYNVITHPDYNDGISNDIALLKMTEPFEFNELVHPLPISRVSCVAVDEPNTFLGWDKGSEGIGLLHAADMTIVPFDECYETIHSVYSDNLPLQKDIHICIRGSSLPCILDEGGPLIQDNRLVGILSWLPDTCLNDNIPAIFTNTGYYKNFIKQHVDDLL